MNHQVASARPATPARGEITGLCLVDTRAHVSRPDRSQHRSEFADHPRHRPRLRGEEPGAAVGDNNEFMTVLSHELRNCLCAVRFAAGILRMETSAPPAAVKARLLIEHQVAHMTRLVDDLLDVSHIRHGRLSLQPQRVDLCVVVAQAVKAVAFAVQERHHHLSTCLPAAPLWLTADPARLEQILVNLLLNAAKYTDPNGRIWLSVQRDQTEAVVRIRDTGIGIEANVLPRVFDLFVQADPSSQRAQAGLGVGLAVVRNLVERHGGRVDATSAGRGTGSEFTVRLPVAPA